MDKKKIEKVLGEIHPYNHDGEIPEVSNEDIKEILEEDGENFKVRMNDGCIAIVKIK
jgi:hypothetical protein